MKRREWLICLIVACFGIVSGNSLFADAVFSFSLNTVDEPGIFELNTCDEDSLFYVETLADENNVRSVASVDEILPLSEWGSGTIKATRDTDEDTISFSEDGTAVWSPSYSGRWVLHHEASGYDKTAVFVLAATTESIELDIDNDGEADITITVTTSDGGAVTGDGTDGYDVTGVAQITRTNGTIVEIPRGVTVHIGPDGVIEVPNDEDVVITGGEDDVQVPGPAEILPDGTIRESEPVVLISGEVTIIEWTRLAVAGSWRLVFTVPVEDIGGEIEDLEEDKSFSIKCGSSPVDMDGYAVFTIDSAAEDSGIATISLTITGLTGDAMFVAPADPKPLD